MPRYWLNTFDRESWQFFLGLSESMLGSKWPRPGISLGDIFLCYVRSEGKLPGVWTSAERVVSQMKFDDRLIYKGGVWPYRWDVAPVVSRRLPEAGLIGRDLARDLEMFAALGPSHWGSALRTQGREMLRKDGETLIELLGS